MEFAKYIETVPNFPKEGVVFRHVGPLLRDRDAFKSAVSALLERVSPKTLSQVDIVAGLDARGFIFATAIQFLSKIGLSQVLIRKKSKLPGKTISTSYSSEYAGAELELEVGAIPSGSRVLIVDDLLATGGSMLAAASLVKEAGGIPCVFATLIELVGLKGRGAIETAYPEAEVVSLLCYKADSLDEKPLIESSSIVHYRPVEFDSQDDRVVVMSHSSLDPVADRLAQIKYFRRSHVDWSKFPDGWSNITFEPSETLANRDVVFMMNVSRMDIFAEQLSLLVALPRQLIKSLTVVIPYLGPATHERVDYSGMLATVEPILKIISSSVPPTRNGPVVLKIYDIHALQIRFYPTDNVIMKLSTTIPLMKEYLLETLDRGFDRGENRMAVAFPDDGAYKRFKYHFQSNCKVVVCSKVRDGDTRRVNIKDYYGWGKDEKLGGDIIIVDDLVQSGGTMIECAKALKAAGFGDVYAYATHAVFPRDSYRKISPDLFKEFIVTDTNSEVTYILANRKPFTVLGTSQRLGRELVTQLDLKMRSGNTRRETRDIYVASTNKSKLKAVWLKYSKETYDVRIFGVDIPSGIPEQPIGIEQTKQGALNRLLGLEKFLEWRGLKNYAMISIENGIFEHNGSYFDYPAVLVRRGGMTDECFDSSSIVEIPKQYVKYVEKSIELKQSRTFGSLMCQDLGVDEWHHFVTGNKRSFYIVKALEKCP